MPTRCAGDRLLANNGLKARFALPAAGSRHALSCDGCPQSRCSREHPIFASVAPLFYVCGVYDQLCQRRSAALVHTAAPTPAVGLQQAGGPKLWVLGSAGTLRYAGLPVLQHMARMNSSSTPSQGVWGGLASSQGVRARAAAHRAAARQAVKGRAWLSWLSLSPIQVPLSHSQCAARLQAGQTCHAGRTGRVQPLAGSPRGVGAALPRQRNFTVAACR